MFACEGEEGMVGPAGPAGADGRDGADGEIQVGTYRHYYFSDDSWNVPALQGK